MAGESYSTNMNLPIPGVGVTDGPTYASDVNTCLSLVDLHDHSTGFGVQITPSGLNINSDLSFGSNNATTIRSVRLSSQSAALALATDLNCVYVISGNLYYNNSSGTSVQITSGSSLAGAAGTISGLPYGTASASYNSGTSTFAWQSATNKSAYMDCSSVLIRNFTTSSYACTLAAPAAMSGDQTVTLPTIPAATSILMMSNTGAISNVQYLTNSNILAGTITTTEIASSTITASNIANATITGAKIASATVTGSNMVNETVGTSQLASGAVTTVKITDANVTRAKLEAVGQSVSSSSGTFTTAASATWTDVTNLTASLTSTGRPVMLILQPVPNAGIAQLGSSGSGTFYIRINNTTDSEVFEFDLTNAAGAMSTGTFNVMDTGTSGAKSWKAQVYGDGATLTVKYYQLIAYEL